MFVKAMVFTLMIKWFTDLKDSFYGNIQGYLQADKLCFIPETASFAEVIASTFPTRLMAN